MKQRITGADIKQERALETRDRLLVSALAMYEQKGYHKTTMDEIAKHAGLSVGIAYRYFKNKKEMLLGALQYGFDHIADLSGTEPTDLFGGGLDAALKSFEKIHKEHYALHEEIEGLRHTDAEVRQLYREFASKAIRDIFDCFPDEWKNKPNALENLYIVIDILESYCHHYMHEDLSPEHLMRMRKRTLELAKMLFLC